MRFESTSGRGLQALDTVPILRKLSCPVMAHGIYVDVDESRSLYTVDEIVSRMDKLGYRPSREPAPSSER